MRSTFAWIGVLVSCSRPPAGPPVDVMLVIGPAGGVIASADGAARLVVPPGALRSATAVELTRLSDDGLPRGAIAGTGWRVGPHGLAFATPSTLCVAYRDEDLPGDRHAWLALARLAAPLAGTRDSGDAPANTVCGGLDGSGDYAGVDLVLADAAVELAHQMVHDVDVLFVIDNSPSMTSKQDLLAANFPAFMNRIVSFGLGTHVGVVSTDMGAGSFSVETCRRPGGDRGALQSSPRGACQGPAGHFIDVPASGANAADAAAAFSCIARLGDAGCGFEMPLESMRRALSPPNTDAGGPNSGFLREDAALAIVLLGDEDDCSAANGGLFDPADTTVSSSLGPLQSFRCSEFGYLCDGQPIGREGGRTYQHCVPGRDWLHPVSEYVSFLSGLKPAGGLVIAAIAGPADGTLATQVDQQDNPQVSPSCLGPGPSDHADPSIRTRALIDAFGERGRFESICQSDLTGALDVIGQLVIDRAVLGWCLPFAPTDLDPSTPAIDATCRVEADAAGTLPPCPSDRAGSSPCWQVKASTACGSGFEFDVAASDPASVGEHVHVTCQTLAAP